jgi:DNA-binding MarR family transcriptional regulator
VGPVVRRGAPGATPARESDWTFLTNHAHVLLSLARDPHCRLRDVAVRVGITERSVQAIVADLEAEGYLTRTRVGRRNVYRLHPQRRFRHPAESRHRIGELLELFASDVRDVRADEGPGPD